MNQNKRLFLDLHAIQTLPPSNVNRDDTGSPKTAQYGGVKRSRVSSQAWKRAMRLYFYQNSAQSNVGVRTLDIVSYLAQKIQQLEPTKDDDEALKLADTVLNDAGVKTKDFRAKALFFLGDTQAQKLAKAAIAGEKDKKILKQMLRDNPAIDIALFGRMVADDPSLNEDASSQVAHAISTHSVQTEFDFYTAVDDLAPEDNAGAGMLGTIEFNSSTLYRYANVAVHELARQLENNEATVETLKLFVESFAKSMPTGKANTFANQTLPHALLITLREDRPVNLVTAFEKPVRSTTGYVEESVEKLFAEFAQVDKFVDPPLATLCLTLKGIQLEQDQGKNEPSLTALLQDLEKHLETFLHSTQQGE